MFKFIKDVFVWTFKICFWSMGAFVWVIGAIFWCTFAGPAALFGGRSISAKGRK